MLNRILQYMGNCIINTMDYILDNILELHINTGNFNSAKLIIFNKSFVLNWTIAHNEIGEVSEAVQVILVSGAFFFQMFRNIVTINWEGNPVNLNKTNLNTFFFRRKSYQLAFSKDCKSCNRRRRDHNHKSTFSCQHIEGSSCSILCIR